MSMIGLIGLWNWQMKRELTTCPMRKAPCRRFKRRGRRESRLVVSVFISKGAGGEDRGAFFPLKVDHTRRGHTCIKGSHIYEDFRTQRE